MSLDLQKALEFAVATAYAAGRLQKEKYEKRGLVVQHKGLINLVTEVDLECEKLITSAISKNYPDHEILAEEGTDVKSGSGYAWYVDPLDGTTNYAHGFPFFAPSIALSHKGEAVVGAVYDPMRDEMFSGTRGGGAFLNGVRVAVSAVDKMDDALLATGFPYDLRTNKNNNVENFGRVALRCQAVLGGRARRRWTFATWRAAGSRDFGRCGSTRGTWRLARCSSRRPAGSSPTCGEGRWTFLERPFAPRTRGYTQNSCRC